MEQKNKKITWLVIACVCLAVVGGSILGARAYLSFRQARLIRQARRYISRSDPSRATLCLRSALAHNPKDLDACRLMAQLAEASLSPSALLWRARVVEFNPRSLDDRLRLAQAATLLREYSYAMNALESVPPEDQKTAAYQRVAGEIAATASHYADAEQHFAEAARLEPGNVDLQFSLAVVRLHDTNNAAALSQARATLGQMAANTTNAALHSQALREMAIDSIRWKQWDQALALARDLQRQSNSMFSDRLLSLEVLQESRPAEFKPALAACQSDAAAVETNAYQLANWELNRGAPKDALAWMRRLPVQMQTNQSIEVLMADCCVKVEDWNGLMTAIQNQNWGDLEFLRHGFQARASRGQGLEVASKAQWEQAVELTRSQGAHLVMLLRLAAEWRWRNEAEDILWSIVNKYPNERWASATLAKALYAGGRTRSLLDLFNQECKRTPSNLAAKNNAAMTALLLGVPDSNPTKLAKEVYQQDPTNSSYASTYALSLYLQTNSPEALKVLERLSPRELEDPSISGCYGMVLKATGHPEKARKYLNLATKVMLLPEERQLIDKARAGI
ncbi:MAG TPA: hypothetical protein VGO59_11835 [Verrucomicrobiae bacterium]|jgi:predicted Zn-dependent protease